MQNKKAIIAGATGLIGKFVLSYLLHDKSYEQIIVISRKPLPINDKKIKNIIADYNNLENFSSDLVADDVFCCLGTTINVAGSKENFKQVDLYYPIKLANITHKNGAKKFLCVSAMGANKNSQIFYNQVKGELEEQLKTIGFKGLYIFRPSLLLGMRKEFRLAERIAIITSKIWSPLISLFAKQYKPIDAMVVAYAMHNKAVEENTEQYLILNSDAIQEVFNKRSR